MWCIPEQIACQACGKMFSNEGQLKKHEKPHTADRPFVCEIRTKGFTTQAHLKEHLKIYTGCRRGPARSLFIFYFAHPVIKG